MNGEEHLVQDELTLAPIEKIFLSWNVKNYFQVEDSQAVKSLSNIRLCKTPALLLLSVVVLIFL